MRSLAPNLLTASRGLSGPIILLLVVVFGWDEAAFVLFLVAILTDLADGPLARALGATSAVGRWLDPTADKLLADFTWLAVGLVGWAPWWIVAPMILRDMGVALGWWITRGRPRIARPHLLGRLMVSFEGVALPVLLFRNPWLDVHWPSVGLVLGAISLGLAALSAALYIGRIVLAGPIAASVLRTRPWGSRPSSPT